MSTLFIFCKAWMIGIAIAAPVGPIGMLCIKKSLELGLRGALLVGLGAALADSVYGMIAATSLSAIEHVLLSKAHIIKLIGGIFLLFLAYKEVKTSITNKNATTKSKTQLRMVGEVFLLTVTNPMTILSFIGVFASITSGPASLFESIIMVAGIFFGSMTWWCILGSIITKIKHKLPTSLLERIKWLSCIILAFFGTTAVISACSYLLNH